jgi:hypothetical protein
MLLSAEPVFARTATELPHMYVQIMETHCTFTQVDSAIETDGCGWTFLAGFPVEFIIHGFVAAVQCGI